MPEVIQRYRCEECDWEGTEKEMDYADDSYIDEDGVEMETCSFTVCPKRGFWHFNGLTEDDGWIKI